MTRGTIIPIFLIRTICLTICLTKTSYTTHYVARKSCLNRTGLKLSSDIAHLHIHATQVQQRKTGNRFRTPNSHQQESMLEKNQRECEKETEDKGRGGRAAWKKSQQCYGIPQQLAQSIAWSEEHNSRGTAQWHRVAVFEREAEEEEGRGEFGAALASWVAVENGQAQLEIQHSQGEDWQQHTHSLHQQRRRQLSRAVLQKHREWKDLPTHSTQRGTSQSRTAQKILQLVPR